MRNKTFALMLGAVAAVAASLPAAATPAPRMAAQSFAQLPQPLPYPYDEAADSHAQLAAAMKAARARHKLLLVDLGGNWCGDCRVLAGTMAQPELARFLATHYVVQTIDVGRFTRNMDIPARFGAGKPEGVPALLILDPRSGRLLNKGRVTALADARSMTPQALADWLAQWVR